MIAYVTIGVDDIARAERFYSAFLPALGYGLETYHGDLSYALPTTPGQSPASPEFYVKRPFNGSPASAGNGTMVAFEARNQAQVRALTILRGGRAPSGRNNCAARRRLALAVRANALFALAADSRFGRAVRVDHERHCGAVFCRRAE